MGTFQHIQRENEQHSQTIIQPVLEVGKEDDEHEKEANHVADKVMKMSDSEEEEKKMKESSSKVQMMPDSKTSTIQESPVKVRMQTDGSTGGMMASKNVEQGINKSKGEGQLLSPDLRDEMGSKMNADLNSVKIHTDENAVQMNKEVGAKAFTHGNDVYFNKGQYDPESSQGKHLLAHELTHAVQQASVVKRKIQRQRLKDFVKIKDADLNLSNTDIESTNEYKAYMNPGLVWQKELKLTADEARLACLLILNAMRDGEIVNWQLKARTYALAARDRLNQRGQGIEGPKRLDTEISIVNESHAEELFDQLSVLTFFNDAGEETPIPFHYPADGCYARAHLMAERLTSMGYASQKKFVMSTKSGGLTIKSDYSDDAPIGQTATTTWWYHVAPIIPVKKADNSIVDMVMDPSLSDHPITVSEWTGLMRSDSFSEMPLDDIKGYLDTHSNMYPVDENVTYSADRSTFFPREFYESEDKTHEESQMNSVRPRISDYAIKASVHELAQMIRIELKKTSGNIDIASIISKIKTLDATQKLYFKSDFSNLLVELQVKVSKIEMDEINTELIK